MSERGLGGLGALIPASTASGLRQVPVDAIKPNPWQPRTHFDSAELEELAQSIRQHGVLQPILVSQQADGSFQLITGERRWRAVQLTGLPTIPALVKEATPQASLEMALVENIQRRDLNPLEEAHAYRQLLDEHGLTQEQLAQRIGKSRVAVTNTLRLLHVPDEVREALADGLITEGHAR
ncbi:MAG: ParB/RepB/Spo0J family partition protein, partial [Chloroflexi bacterium]|nr:ParB/RepB/Spo0J family partition protein [Chloroflexota bacterium]